MFTVRTLLSGMMLGLGVLTHAAAADPASSYPDKTVKLVVPFTPGGQLDTVARLLTHYATKALGQSVIVENVPGGGGNIGAAKVRNAPPDGYTLLMMGGNHTIAKSLYPKPGFDVLTDFSPISMISISPHVVLVNSSLPIKSLADLKEYAKKHPDTLNYGSPGMGSSMHLTFEMLKSQYGLNVTHVPYRGGAQALTDLAANQVQLAIVAVGPGLDVIKADRAHPLAVTSKARANVLPDTPSFAEVGYPELDTGSWMGVAGPKNMPPEIVAKWNALIHGFLNDPDVGAKLESMGFKKRPTTPEQFQKVIESEVQAYSKIVREKNIRPD